MKLRHFLRRKIKLVVEEGRAQVRCVVRQIDHVLGIITLMPKKNVSNANLDRQLPRLAKQATRAAFDRTIKAGRSVVVARDGELQRVYPSGRVEVIRKIARDVKVKKGTVVHIDE